jgi:hypothetical protein
MNERYDVAVIGGGAAGVGAAIGAARAGARTLLVETYGCLGGAATMRGVFTYCGIYTCGPAPRQVVFGVAHEVMDAVAALGGLSAITRFRGVIRIFDPEAVKVALDRVCARAGVDVLLHTTTIGATRTNERVSSVVVHDRNGAREIVADAFVDASGEGDLAAYAGASTRYGNHGSLNIGTLAIRIGGVPTDYAVSPGAWAEAVRAAKARGVAPLTGETGFVGRLPISNDICALLIDEDYDARDGASITAAERNAREQAQAYLDVLRGLPGYEKAYLVSTGPTIGTRESRHIDARYRVTRDDVASGRRFADVVALGAWPMEFHPAPSVPSTWEFVGGDDTYDIPLDALRSANTPNLFAAGRTADGDRDAGASLRVMGTAFATGQAAGIAAAEVARRGDAAYARVRAELDRQDARLDEAAVPG